MKNLIKYHYELAKNIGIESSPTKELMDLGFKSIRINVSHRQTTYCPILIPELILQDGKFKRKTRKDDGLG